VGQGDKAVQTMVGKIRVTADYLKSILETVLRQFESTTPPVTMTFRTAHFNSGHDLKRFAENVGIDIQQGEVEQ
jgi:hypothetical protein